MTSINIPDGLQEILKNYVKAAIRSQPEDIVKWSAEYFKTTDERQYTTIGLHKNCKSIYNQDRTLFRILAFQLGTTLSTKERIEEVWSDLSLDFNLLEQIYTIGKFHEEHVQMVEFLGVTFGHWTKSLKETVLMCCEAFCKCLATDGYFLHADVACKLYGFLAKLDCSLPVDRSGDNAVRNAAGASSSDGGDVGGNGKPSVKTAKSLDVFSVQPPSSLAENVVNCKSLESIFCRPATADERDVGNNDMEFTRDGGGGGDDMECTHGAGVDVPGIGPAVPGDRIQKVMEYFQKCAADNGGYVYDFDLENDNCPPLDAADVNTVSN